MRQRGVRAFVAGRDLIVGDHAVDQHIGHAVDGGDEYAAHEQQRQPAGEQEQNLQRRLLVDAEGELKAAGADVLDLDLDSSERFQHVDGHGDGNDRAHHQRELDAT